MKRISLALYFILLLIVSSCAKDVYEVSDAPRTQNQAGIIASCVTREDASSLARSQGIKYRVINEKRKLIEFYNVSQTQLKENFPNAKLKANTVFSKPLITFTTNNVAISSQNYQYYGSHTPSYRNGDVSAYFPHLYQIHAGDFVDNQMGENVVIAVIDTGVYYNHPHISSNILTNPSDLHGENGNSRDDDGNGLKDDYVGWDFYNGDAYPIDDNGHGTHVAGLAAGTYGGVAPKAKILPVKVLSNDGSGDLGTIAAGILYAIDRGADIINLSLGGPGGSEASSELSSMFSAMSISKQNDVLVIAAAGNGGNDGMGDCNDTNPVYPANFTHQNVMSVAAVDQFDRLASYSNFGIETVHISAPGGSQSDNGLLSLGLPSCFGPCSDNALQYTKNSGTSMATPIIAGVAALIKGANPSLSAVQIKQILIEQGEFLEELYEKTKYGKRVDARASLAEVLIL
jgi:subtilisin family serine protease